MTIRDKVKKDRVIVYIAAFFQYITDYRILATEFLEKRRRILQKNNRYTTNDSISHSVTTTGYELQSQKVGIWSA